MKARRTVEICNERGLHARASAKFVKTAAGFDAEVTVTKDGHTVDARSIMGLMMLAAGPGAEIEIVNKRGLHARASAKFVKTAASFDAEVRVSKDGQTVDARSIMGLLMLGAGNGCGIEIVAEGPEAEAAVAALAELVGRRFDEEQ